MKKEVPNEIIIAITGMLAQYGFKPEEVRTFCRGEEKKTLTPAPQPLKMYRRKELAKYLHVSLPTIDRWHKEGRLKGKKVSKTILYSLDDVEGLWSSEQAS